MDVFIITRLDTLYSMPGEPTEALGRFKAAVRRLIALSPRSLQLGRVRVVHVDPQLASLESQGLGLENWETRVVARELMEAGANVIEWEPAREEFISVLMRSVGVYR